MQVRRRVAAIIRDTRIVTTVITFRIIHDANHGGIIRLTFMA